MTSIFGVIDGILQSMLLDILDNLPWLCISSNQLKMVLWLLKQCKVAGVPLYSRFRKLQDHLCGLCRSKPQDYISGMGNRLFVNDVQESIPRVSLQIVL
jgi:hypothetical protein